MDCMTRMNVSAIPTRHERRYSKTIIIIDFNLLLLI